MEHNYIIKPDGQIYRRVIYPDEKMDVNGQIMEALVHDAISKVGALFELPGYGPVDLIKHRDMLYWRLYPERLIIDAPFMVHQGHTVPVFKEPAGSTRMRLTWTPPASMLLRLLISSNQGFEHQKTWMFALDGSGKTYRLPIANLFEDCGVCLGKSGYGYGDTGMQFLKNVLTQYETAPYNADLAYYENDTIKMFRWQPEGSGFKVIPPEGDWTKLCQLVSVEISKYLTV